MVSWIQILLLVEGHRSLAQVEEDQRASLRSAREWDGGKKADKKTSSASAKTRKENYCDRGI